MSKPEIVFSPRAQKRFEEIAEYLYKKSQSKDFVRKYLNRFEMFLGTVLVQFPESGTPMNSYGKGVRRIVYEKYCFLYRTKGNRIEILTVYRENLP